MDASKLFEKYPQPQAEHEEDLLEIAEKLSHEETSEVLKPLTPNFYDSEKKLPNNSQAHLWHSQGHPQHNSA